MPPYRIVKKNIAREKEFNTAVDLSAYGISDVNDINQLRAFVNNNANNKDPLLSRSVEYTRYRIAALQEIDKKSQNLTNPRTGKLSKVIFAGKEVSQVEGHPDVTDCFIMDNINQEEKQTSANGCWSVSMSLLLQSRGVDIDQQMIRAFKPTGDAKYYNDDPMAVEDYMHLIEKVSPNTGLRSRMITSKENFARLSNLNKTSNEYREGVAHVADNFKKVVDESLRRSNSPVSITDNNHFLTVVGTGKKDGKDGFFYKDSLGPEEPNKTYFKTYEDYVNEKLADPIPDNEFKSIQCTFLQDFDVKKEKDSNVKTCDQIVGFPGLKFEDGKIKPAENGADGKGFLKEDDETFIIIAPAESGATKDNTVAIASDGDVTETIYFPSKVLDGSPYLSVEAAEQEMAAEEEFEKPASSALFRSDAYSDYMSNISSQLDSEPLYNRLALPSDPELENKFNKISFGNALNDAMSHLRDVKGNYESLKGLLSNNQPSQRAEEAADYGLTKAVKAAADSINLFLENTSESKDSELYGMMERLHNKLNGLAMEKTTVDAELEMYKNAYVREHDVVLTNDLDKDIDAARLNVANLSFVLSETEPELEKARQDYIKATEAEEAEEKQLKAVENQEKAVENQGNAAEITVDVDKENERLDKAIEDSTKTLHDYYKSLDAVEARLGVKLRDRSAFTEDGQDIGSLAVTNPFPSELSDDEKEKLGKDGAEFNNKIKQEFDTLVKLQSEKEQLNKNQNLEDANALANAPVNDSIEGSKNNDEVQTTVNMVSHAESRMALQTYNRKLEEVLALNKSLGEARKHLDILLATKKSIDLKNEALSKRNDALVSTSEGLLGLSEGLERVDRKFPFFKVGLNKNSEEFQNLHDKIWEIQNKLTPNLSSKEKNNREVDKDYVLGNQFRNDLKELKENAQNYVTHIEALNAEKGKEGPSSDVGKRRLALANNVISFCDQMSQSFEKRDLLENLSENDITRKADRNLRPYNLKNDFSNDAIENQKIARDENAKKEGSVKKSLFEIIMELLGFRMGQEMLQNAKSQDEKMQAQKAQAKETQTQKEQTKQVQAQKDQVKEAVKAEGQNNKEKSDEIEAKKEVKAEAKEETKEETKEDKAEAKEEVKVEVKEEKKEEVKEEKSDSEVTIDFVDDLIKSAAKENEEDKIAMDFVDDIFKNANKEVKIEAEKEVKKEEKKLAGKASNLDVIDDADAALNDLENEIDNNPGENFLDSMIADKKKQKESVNQFINQEEARLDDLNKKISKKQAEIQSNPIIQGAKNVEVTSYNKLLKGTEDKKKNNSKEPSKNQKNKGGLNLKETNPVLHQALVANGNRIKKAKTRYNKKMDQVQTDMNRFNNM